MNEIIENMRKGKQISNADHVQQIIMMEEKKNAEKNILNQTIKQLNDTVKQLRESILIKQNRT